MKFNLPNALSSRLAHTGLVASKHSPQFLFYGGLVLGAATVVSACRATLALEEVLDDVEADHTDVDQVADSRGYSNKEAKRLHYYVTGRGLVRVGKLYLPSVVLGAAAVACLTSSHNQLTRRNAGLSAALVATEKALDRYRDRVREHVGEERELEIWQDQREKKVPVLDDEGRETKSTTKIKTAGGYSPYARVWGRDTSTEWDPESSYNLAKLRSAQERCTLLLNSRGHVMLNDVFDELGLSRTPEGAVVGWLSQKYGGDDGYVDFGVLRKGNEVEWLNFARGQEDSILLDFNVDGEIWRQI